LDYYTVIVYPFAALLCAPWLVSASQHETQRAARWTQVLMGVLTFALAVWVAGQIGHTQITMLLAAAALCWLVYAVWQRHQQHGLMVLVHPVAGVLALYAVLEAMTVVAHTRFSIPYNVKPWLAAEPTLPVMVYRLDPPVTYELGLYRQTAPVVRVNAVNELPATGDYYLIAKTSDMKDFQNLDARAKPLIEAQWVDHKTGTLPRQIALAAGRAPLERFSVYRVTAR
jgi:hypothetical protein